jgi:hypothetical protein
MSFYSNNECKVIEVIINSTLVRGDGSEEDPYRTVINIYTKDGELITTIDPRSKNIVSEYNLYLHRKKNNLKIKKEDFPYLSEIDSNFEENEEHKS